MVRTPVPVREAASPTAHGLAGRSTEPEAPRPGRQYLFPLIVFAATVVLLMPQALAGQKTYAAVDILQLGSPYRDIIDQPPAPELAAPIQTDQAEQLAWPTSFFRELREGTWSLWDPTVASGTPKGTLPLLGLLSPFSAGFLVLPAWYAVTLKAALGLLFCQWFTYLLTRRFGAGVVASTLAGVAYAYTGTNVVLIHRMTAFLLAPALLWAAHRLVARPDVRRVAVLGGFVAWAWFEGFPSGFAYVFYLTAAWTAWLLLARFWQTRRSRERPERLRALVKGGGSFAAAGLLGFGLMAISLLPFVDEVRRRGVLERRGVGHLPSFNVFGLIDIHATGPPWWTGVHPIENVASIGTIVLLAAALGLVGAARRRVRLTHDGALAWGFMCAVAVFGILICYVGTFVLDFLSRLPGFADNPVHRSRFVIPLAASIIAALALDSWWKSRPPAPRAPGNELAPRWVSIGTLAFCVTVFAVYADDFLNKVSDAGRGVEVGRGFAIAAGLAALAVFAAWIARRRPRLVVPVASGIAALLLVQLAWPLRDFTPEADVELFYSRQQGHDTLAELTDGRYRFTGATFHTFLPNSAQLFDVPDMRGFTIQSEEFRRLVETAVPGAVSRDIFKVIADRDEWNFSSPVLDDLAVGVVALSTDDLPYGEIVAEYQTWSSWMEANDLPPDAGTGLAPGPIAGALVPLRRSGDCDGARVRVSIAADGNVLDTAERPAFDANGDWLSFALTGQAIGAGDLYELRVASSKPACAISAGVVDDGASVRLARQTIVEAPDSAIRLIATEQAWFYERPNAWELVSTHGRSRAFSTQSEALDYVASRPATEDDVASFVGDASQGKAGGVSGTVDSFEISANRVEARVTTPTKNLVVVSQNYSPGWSAQVDGEPEEIVAIDGALMGVFVPAGRHELTLSYRPRSFVIGAAISAVALFALIAALVLPSLAIYIRRSRERQSDP